MHILMQQHGSTGRMDGLERVPLSADADFFVCLVVLAYLRPARIGMCAVAACFLARVSATVRLGLDRSAVLQMLIPTPSKDGPCFHK